jgi:hypothetical protein
MGKSVKIFQHKLYARFRIKDASIKPFIVYVGVKHNKTFIIDAFHIELEICWYINDWMVPSVDIIDGKKYSGFSKNPKYMNEEIESWSIPKW